MIAATELQFSKQTFECLRCGHQDTRRQAPPFSSAEQARRFRDKADEAAQMAELAQTESRRTTLEHISAAYIRTAEQLEALSEPIQKTPTR